MHRHVAVSVMILVPLHLEGHQGAVGLCTGKPILDIFLKDTSHIYSPPAIPPMPVSELIPAGEAGQSRYNCLTMGYNYLSSLQRTTIFIDGSAERKVSDASFHCEQLALNPHLAGGSVRGFGPQIFAEIPRAACYRQVYLDTTTTQTHLKSKKSYSTSLTLLQANCLYTAIKTTSTPARARRTLFPWRVSAFRRCVL